MVVDFNTASYRIRPYQLSTMSTIVKDSISYFEFPDHLLKSPRLNTSGISSTQNRLTLRFLV